MPRNRTGPLLPILALLLCACGYRPLLTRGGDLRLSVPAVENGTSYPDLGVRLTSSLRRKLSAAGVNVTSTNSRTMRLDARVLSVSSTPGALTSSDGALATVDEAWTVRVGATLCDDADEVVWGEIVLEGHARSPVTADVIGSDGLAEDARAAALDEIADRLVSLVLEGP